MSGLIAIVGRPNVGKSALFNRIVGRRIAIVHDQPGVTRDRVIAEAEWRGRPVTVVDTGGIGLSRGEKVSDVIVTAALQQVEMAIEAANVIVLVVNVQDGVVPLDREVAAKLRAAGKPVLVAVNKVDNARAQSGVDEFQALGFDQVFPVTAIHGLGIEDVMEAAMAYIPEPAAEPEASADEADDAGEAVGVVVEAGQKPEEGREGHLDKTAPRGPLKLAIVGRPNVGKSSIINALTGSERVIVSPIPGTTRDAVDVPFEVMTEGVSQKWLLIDTAGLRKARRVSDTVEFFSVERTKDSIARCDIAVLVIDAEHGITEQDKKIADVIVEQRRACVVVVNKWDLVTESVKQAREEEVRARREKSRDRDDREKRLTTLAEFGEWVQSRLFFLDYAPVIFTSATDGFQLDRLLEAVRYVAGQLRQKVPTAILNRTLNDAVERKQPISAAGHRLKFFYATQVRIAPPTFLLFVNRHELFDTTYTKYLTGSMRAAFGYEGCPIVLVPKARPKTVEPIRKYLPRQSGGTAGTAIRGRKEHKGEWVPDREPGGGGAGSPPRPKPAFRQGFKKAAKARPRLSGKARARSKMNAKPKRRTSRGRG